MNEVVLSIGRGVPFFAALNFLEFGKKANSVRLSVAKGFSLVRFQLVWRQLEFAFFGAPTSVGALFYFKLYFLKNLYFYKNLYKILIFFKKCERFCKKIRLIILRDKMQKNFSPQEVIMKTQNTLAHLFILPKEKNQTKGENKNEKM